MRHFPTDISRPWGEGIPDPCPPGTPLDWFPVHDLTPVETRRLTSALWKMERHRYDRADWGGRNGAASYQGRGV